MDIYVNEMISAMTMQIDFLRKQRVQMLNRRSSASVVVCIHGPPQSGKITLARFLSKKLRIELHGFEAIPIEVVNGVAFGKAKYNECTSNAFVAVYLVCSAEKCVSDLNISVVGLYSKTKLLKHLNVKLANLRAFGYNLSLTMCDSATDNFTNAEKLNIIHKELYSKKSRFGIDHLASDLDFIAFLDECTEDGITDQFINSNSILRLNFRKYCKGTTVKTLSNEMDKLDVCLN
jgi:hypothetical protein